MDIIKQRIENINRNASFNRSNHDLYENSFHSDNKATPKENAEAPKTTTTTTTTTEISTTPVNNANGNTQQVKPLKRKLFAPPSLFPEHNITPTPTPQKTDKKTAIPKRKRNDQPIRDQKSKTDEKKLPEKPANKKITIPRRSTMFFEKPIPKSNSDTNSQTMARSTASTVAASTINRLSTVSLVCTSMHQPQIDFITEVRQG